MLDKYFSINNLALILFMVVCKKKCHRLNWVCFCAFVYVLLFKNRVLTILIKKIINNSLFFQFTLHFYWLLYSLYLGLLIHERQLNGWSAWNCMFSRLISCKMREITTINGLWTLKIRYTMHPAKLSLVNINTKSLWLIIFIWNTFNLLLLFSYNFIIV